MDLKKKHMYIIKSFSDHHLGIRIDIGRLFCICTFFQLDDSIEVEICCTLLPKGIVVVVENSFYFSGYIFFIMPS